MDLVHIYDRPMKIYLHTDVIGKWQKLINERIADLKDQFEKSKKECEVAFEDFIKDYNLKEENTEEPSPVEFINYSIENVEDLYYPFLAKGVCKIATGIRYENPLINSIKNQDPNATEKQLRRLFNENLLNIKESVSRIKIEVIFNSELLQNLIDTKEFEMINKLIKEMGFDLKNIDVRVTDTNFSNFSLTDGELIQPSFDPSNKLLGAYVSRNKNIYQIFFEKFNELFIKALSINNYLKQGKQFAVEELSDLDKFTLCLL
ncbi:MAG: hypothetical protein P8Y97_05635 [Candidatus Lokiarchaeota archaeon]